MYSQFNNVFWLYKIIKRKNGHKISEQEIIYTPKEKHIGIEFTFVNLGVWKRL